MKREKFTSASVFSLKIRNFAVENDTKKAVHTQL